MRKRSTRAVPEPFMPLSSNEPVPVASLFITMPWVALLVSRPVTLSAFAASIVSNAPLLISRLWQTAGDAGAEVICTVVPVGITTSVDAVGTPPHQLVAVSQLPEAPPIHCVVITWLSAVLVLPAKLAVALNSAVMECVPLVNDEITMLPCPLAFNTVEVPRVVAPSLKVTVPSEATAVPPLLTVAVRVTGEPGQAVPADEVSTVAVAVGFVLPMAKSPKVLARGTVACRVVAVRVPMVGDVHTEVAYLPAEKVAVLAPASTSAGRKVKVAL